MKKLWTKFKNLRLWRVIGGAFRVVGNSIRRFFGFVGRHWRAATLIGLAVAIALGTFLALFLTLPVKSVEIEGEVILLQGESYAGGLNVKATTKAGLVHREEVLTSMLSGYDPNVVGAQEVTVTYKRKKVKATVKVLAPSAVELRVRAGTLPVSYEPNDPLGRRGVLDLYYGERLIRSVPVTRENATGFSTVLSGNYSIFLNYKGLLARYDYTVLEVIESITPIGILYAAQGEELSKENAIGNLKFHVKYKDGREEDVMIYDERIALKEGDPLEETGEDYKASLTFTYKGVEVVSPVTAYTGELLMPKTVTLKLDKRAYIEGETFDYSTAYLEVEYERFPGTLVLLRATMDEIIVLQRIGEPESAVFVPITDGTEPIVFNEIGYTYLVARYIGVDSERITVRVVSEEDAERVTGLSTTWHGLPTGMPKKGQELDCTDATLDVIYGFGYSKETVPLTLEMVTGYDKENAGDQVLTITYGEWSTDVPIRIADPESGEVTDVYDVVGWNEDTYYTSDELVIPAAAYLDVEIGYGADRIRVPLTDEEVEITGFTPHVLERQTLLIRYQGFELVMNIEVVDDREEEIVGFSAPWGITVNVGEELDLSGECTLYYTRRSETMTVAEVLAAGGRIVGNYDLTKKGDYAVWIYHPDCEQTGHYTAIHVESTDPYVTGIRLDVSGDSVKTTYKVGESLSVTGMKLWLCYSDGSETDITDELGDNMFSYFNTTATGARTATVTYFGEDRFVTGFDYIVE
ncbi:MAG: bacterial Ig-like domain-containing protein [Clostridia bacterium]|nr:bacterial Ig-like domain-containing protein [Clostridia bacterium]